MRNLLGLEEEKAGLGQDTAQLGQPESKEANGRIIGRNDRQPAQGIVHERLAEL